MKKTSIAAALLLVIAGSATAAHAGVNFNVSVGLPGTVVESYPAPAPVVIAQPPSFIYSPAPSFIYSPDLGYYVSTGTPEPVAYVDRCYYRYNGGAWYLATSYGGPWSPVPVYRLPHALRGHSYREVSYYRDHEYRHYLRDRDGYRGRWFRPGGEHRGDEHRRGEWRGDGRGDGRWGGERR